MTDWCMSLMDLFWASQLTLQFYAAKSSLTKLPALLRKEAVVAVLGCGPVGLCALVTASTYKPKHILTVDHVQERRETSVTLGAEAWSGSSDRAEMDERINVLTDGRGVDIVLEAVGSSSALQLAFEIVRPGGVITSVGVHSESFPFTAAQGKSSKLLEWQDTNALQHTTKMFSCRLADARSPLYLPRHWSVSGRMRRNSNS